MSQMRPQSLVSVSTHPATATETVIHLTVETVIDGPFVHVCAQCLGVLLITLAVLLITTGTIALLKLLITYILA